MTNDINLEQGILELADYGINLNLHQGRCNPSILKVLSQNTKSPKGLQYLIMPSTSAELDIHYNPSNATRTFKQMLVPGSSRTTIVIGDDNTEYKIHGLDSWNKYDSLEGWKEVDLSSIKHKQINY